MPSWIEPYLLATTLAVLVTMLGVMPRFVRESRTNGVILLALVALAGGSAAEWFHQPWLPGAVLLLPVLVWLWGRRGAWNAWTLIAGACLLLQTVASLLPLGVTLLQSSGISRALGALMGGTRMLSVVATAPAIFDLLNVPGRGHFPERDRMLAAPEPSHWPGCCVQVPTHNEPPELVARVILQLLRQQYPGPWMIQVIDNHTPDPATWKPIARLCQRYHQRIQFLHLEQWPGFKAGALNEGTRRLPAWGELIAVVDADDLAHPQFLRATVRHFVDPSVAFVQTPQHYRAWQGHPYFDGLNYMYAAFFATYLASRREPHSIMCTGTMGLVRRSSLEEVGLWDETCVTEDAELSIRLLGKGWKGVDDHRPYGAGLMPFEFDALKKQRFRWAFGTMQLLKKHWRPLLGLSSPGRYHLTLTQRLCYLGIGFQYLTEALTFCSTLLLGGAVGVSTLMGHHMLLPLPPIWLIPVLLLLTTGIRTVWGLREATGCKPGQAIGALLFFYALSWVTCQACLTALFRQKGVFLRTPKIRPQHRRWQRALLVTAQETLLSAVLVGGALGMSLLQPASVLAIVLFLLQGLIYGMAPVCALAAEGIWLIPRRLPGTNGSPFSTRRLAPPPPSLLQESAWSASQHRGHSAGCHSHSLVAGSGNDAAHGKTELVVPQVGVLRFHALGPSVSLHLPPDANQALRGPAEWTTDRLFSAQQNPSLQVLVERILMQLFAQVLDRPAVCIKGTSHFFESGRDAQTLAALLCAIEERLQIRLSPEEIIEHPILFRYAHAH
ncbi:MAG: glycosyltransferase [Thermogemmatispora sp.]|uniref:glycosyltransferase n=1 Tax=Thermogemmatispora sp. TaxID=1968838 RepID=UPI0026297889|nr:glycosyltransferase [Thermogemmatispora sp.]MBX5457955.1 glycosyltransferase [Thermogemmatispora sp.]